MGSMATIPADPLESTDWLLVDGTNLLHALSKSATAAPRSTLIGRMRAVVPPSVAIDVVFDGPAEPGMRGQRVATGLRVRYGGPRSADAVLLSLVDEVRGTEGALATAAILVVTDDRELRHALRLKGARTARADWLLGRLERTERGRRPGMAPSADPGTAIGPGRPRPASPSHMPPPTGDDDAPERPGWQPGRGATAKRGNPRRAARRRTS